jgi:hypothetical protein
MIAFCCKVASSNSHRTIFMDTKELSKEQRILRIMRKTLGNVVKDVTPLGGRTNPLSEGTIQDIKDCFGLISDRERELAEALNFDQAKPYYADGEIPNAKVISIVKPPKE